MILFNKLNKLALFKKIKMSCLTKSSSSLNLKPYICISLLTMLALSACGQKTPLIKPKDVQQTQKS